MNCVWIFPAVPAGSDYRHNHYVPVWYQKRFMRPRQGMYQYLDLRPEVVLCNGHRHTRRELRQLGPVSCFAQDDLYTTKWGSVENTEIEQFFFGKIDEEGRRAVEYFAGFQHPDVNGDAYQSLLTYMSIQKLRTPKGLGWLAAISRESNHNLNLIFLQKLQNLFGAIWTECVWQLADAMLSPVKFIISDHPVTVYNRSCFPASSYCLGFNDPDIRLVATHTYFPLSLERVLIMTNLSWVRNPYQNEKKLRPNPNFFRGSIFKFSDIQTWRYLTEQEVLAINYVTKKRACRYIAAAEKEWLYPEKYLLHPHWSKLGRGLLFMPEPRDIHMGGDIYIGYEGGSHDAYSAYGHKPWDKDFENKERDAIEKRALLRFQAEFATMQGPAWRGTSGNFGQTKPRVDSKEYHTRLVQRAKQLRKAQKGR
ncbi:MAG: DUF4238 domain-containing protein [Alphaproteobacteria bacterium]|nr:DUF4238 domain-containing protein [Alphaproteobacteria bacterium]